METPPFWWYLPGKLRIFMGYVSFREGIQILWRLKDIYICHQVPSVCPDRTNNSCKIDLLASKIVQETRLNINTSSRHRWLWWKQLLKTGRQQLFPGALCLGRLDGMEWLHTSLRWWPTDASSCYHSGGSVSTRGVFGNHQRGGARLSI